MSAMFFADDPVPPPDTVMSFPVEFFKRCEHGRHIFDRHVALDVVDRVENEATVTAEYLAEF